MKKKLDDNGAKKRPKNKLEKKREREIKCMHNHNKKKKPQKNKIKNPAQVSLIPFLLLSQSPRTKHNPRKLNPKSQY